MPPAAAEAMRPDSTAAPGGGHFKAMKQKLASGDSPVPALVNQRPAPTSQDKSPDETPLKSATVTLTEHQAAQTVESPQSATSPSAGAATGPKRRLRGSKTKLKLALGEELEQQNSADSTLLATSGDDALLKRRKSKTALAVGKDLREEQVVRVGATQEMIQAMSAQAEHRKVEEEALRELEQDLKNIQNEELRAKNGAVKHFFTDTIPGLFNKPDTAASRPTELEDEYANQ